MPETPEMSQTPQTSEDRQTSGPEPVSRWPRGDLAILALVATGVFLFAVFESGTAQFSSAQNLSNHVTFFLLINLNLLLLLVFVFLVGRNLGKLILERRRRILGSHLRVRLVVAFIALSLGPAVVLFFAAMNFMGNSIEDWFEAKVEPPLEGAHEIVAAYYQDLAADASSAAGELAAAVAATPGGIDDPALASIVTDARVRVRAAAVTVLTPGGRVVRESRDRDRDLPAIPSPEASLLATLASEGAGARILPLDRGDVVRAIAPIVQGGKVVAAALVDEYVPARLADRAAEIERSWREFRELKILRQPVTNTYLLTLALITLVVVFAAIWYGLSLAKTITVPIQRLAEATREIAQGNWDVHIEGAGRDEMGTLVAAFNGMTGDLKRSHAELEERRHHLSTILANVRAGVVSIDPEGRVTTLNAAAERLLGVDGQVARGMPARELFAEHSLDAVGVMIAELFANGVVQRERQVEVVHPDRVTTLLAAAAPLREGAGADERPFGAVLFFEDITEILKVQRMEAWREVARRIAHEIKNPLTPIQLSAQRLHKRYSATLADPVFEECTRTIVKQVEALKTLVNEFSNFARLPTGNQQPNDLNAIAEEALVLYREGHRDIHFELTRDETVPSLSLDHEGIRRVIINLLDNAVAACREVGGDELRIELRTESLPSASLVRLELADNGAGMTPEVKTRLFEPYFSTKREGTGLGLAIVQGVLNEHRAYVRVRDNEPRGSRFLIEFPVGESAVRKPSTSDDLGFAAGRQSR